ncbi:uncharacterized protein LOC121873678 [Homarus americanus]|uniref:Uncharacterized protein n=1 Tax=Homarus americanus TaxID=6706 RepID=A0A8J5JUF4_HOMAM|nr:uncharacterized protein LOC121873678 [Homarus americanus]XP_042233300.1 uncharacterized protein LOC121873678 [Homarus americanus]XP_042233301.1 uncharacterized protein LOC121873678 [Homarus americanus]KAG7162656.1 hypothetical protein Hamer_G019373 [Homarus americanus]
MGCSLRSVTTCGLVLAILDLLHGLGTLAFYGYQFHVHYVCHWNHGIRWCQYYLQETNHSVRVNIGIGEGVVCTIFACLLIVSLCKYKPWLTWLWLLKAVVVVIINGYFIIIWLMEKSRHYHQFWDRHNYDQDGIFLMAGIGLTTVEILIMFIFCCVSGSFTYKIRSQRVPTMETDI